MEVFLGIRNLGWANERNKTRRVKLAHSVPLGQCDLVMGPSLDDSISASTQTALQYRWRGTDDAGQIIMPKEPIKMAGSAVWHL
jgi:hypothetical protein